MNIFLSAYGLRAVFGDNKFEGLLQLHAGISLCFVIDTSVSTERDAIKQEIQKLMSSGSNPYNYILIYTNDGNPTVRSIIWDKHLVLSANVSFKPILYLRRYLKRNSLAVRNNNIFKIS